MKESGNGYGVEITLTSGDRPYLASVGNGFTAFFYMRKNAVQFKNNLKVLMPDAKLRIVVTHVAVTWEEKP